MLTMLPLSPFRHRFHLLPSDGMPLVFVDSWPPPMPLARRELSARARSCALVSRSRSRSCNQPHPLLSHYPPTTLPLLYHPLAHFAPKPISRNLSLLLSRPSRLLIWCISPVCRPSIGCPRRDGSASQPENAFSGPGGVRETNLSLWPEVIIAYDLVV